MHDVNDLQTGVRPKGRVVLVPLPDEALHRLDTSIGNRHQPHRHTVEPELMVAPDGQRVTHPMLVGHPVQQRTFVAHTETKVSSSGWFA